MYVHVLTVIYLTTLSLPLYRVKILYMYYMCYLTSLSARSKHSGIILFTATCLELKRTSEEEQTRQGEISL